MNSKKSNWSKKAKAPAKRQAAVRTDEAEPLTPKPAATEAAPLLETWPVHAQPGARDDHRIAGHQARTAKF